MSQKFLVRVKEKSEKDRDVFVVFISVAADVRRVVIYDGPAGHRAKQSRKSGVPVISGQDNPARILLFALCKIDRFDRIVHSVAIRCLVIENSYFFCFPIY